MILIAESGSTKTNWLTENDHLYETIGFNPLFHTSETIYNELMRHPALLKEKDKYTEIFFYGASCSSKERNNIVEMALRNFFTKASVVEVDHDLKAAAVATYDGRKAIVCILGTGSNSCTYDGHEVYEEIPSLGYVLGDEGSGAYFGKKIISGYLYHELPEATAKLLKDTYRIEKEKIFEHVYQKPHANVYLAGFAKIMSESTDVEFMDKLAEEGFNEFFIHHVCCYENYKSYPVHFVGSIAFHFKHVLETLAKKYGCELGVVDKNPVYRLRDWHLKHVG